MRHLLYNIIIKHNFKVLRYFPNLVAAIFLFSNLKRLLAGKKFSKFRKEKWNWCLFWFKIPIVLDKWYQKFGRWQYSSMVTIIYWIKNRIALLVVINTVICDLGEVIIRFYTFSHFIFSHSHFTFFSFYEMVKVIFT